MDHHLTQDAPWVQGPGLLAFFVSLIGVIIGICLLLAIMAGVGALYAWAFLTALDALSHALSGLGVAL